MTQNRTVSFVRACALALLCGVVLSAGGACKRKSSPPPVTPVAPPMVKEPPKTVEQLADDNWLKLRKEIKNVDGRVTEALSKLEQAAQIKGDRYDGKPDGPEKKAALKEIQQLKADAGDIWDMLRDDAEKLSKDLWANAFRVEVKRWDAATKKLKGLPRLGH